MDSKSEYDAPVLQMISHAPTRVETIMKPSDAYIPPPRYTLAEPMPGQLIRLTVSTLECQPWAPGEHFILPIPSINKLTSHPFTISSVCDQESSNPTGHRVLVFF